MEAKLNKPHNLFSFVWKQNPFKKSLKSILISLPRPLNLRYAWNFGSILLVLLTIQIITGLFLAMNYVGESTLAFSSVDLLTRDIWSGWFIRSAHSKGASFFFLFIFLHIGRGIYYGSFRHQITWLLGTVILLVSMGVAFLGYVLPWGQMSFWAATVITNFMSSIPYIGSTLVIWLWGGYSVGRRTLTRFFCTSLFSSFFNCSFSFCSQCIFAWKWFKNSYFKFTKRR